MEEQKGSGAGALVKVGAAGFLVGLALAGWGWASSFSSARQELEAARQECSQEVTSCRTDLESVSAIRTRLQEMDELAQVQVHTVEALRHLQRSNAGLAAQEVGVALDVLQGVEAEVLGLGPADLQGIQGFLQAAQRQLSLDPWGAQAAVLQAVDAISSAWNRLHPAGA